MEDPRPWRKPLQERQAYAESLKTSSWPNTYSTGRYNDNDVMERGLADTAGPLDLHLTPEIYLTHAKPTFKGEKCLTGQPPTINLQVQTL